MRNIEIRQLVQTEEYYTIRKYKDNKSTLHLQVTAESKLPSGKVTQYIAFRCLGDYKGEHHFKFVVEIKESNNPKQTLLEYIASLETPFFGGKVLKRFEMDCYLKHRDFYLVFGEWKKERKEVAAVC